MYIRFGRLIVSCHNHWGWEFLVRWDRKITGEGYKTSVKLIEVRKNERP